MMPKYQILSNIFFILLLVHGAVLLFVRVYFGLPPQVERLTDYFDNLVCLIFFVDFCSSFYTAKNKKAYLKWGWIDLISSVPVFYNFTILRFFRFLRLVRIVRILGRKSTPLLLKENRKTNLMTMIIMLGFLMVEVSSILILYFEDIPEGNIKTALDAVYWSLVTIATVGYGDFYPVTVGGKVVSMVLVVFGVSVFVSFTSLVSVWLKGDGVGIEKEMEE